MFHSAPRVYCVISLTLTFRLRDKAHFEEPLRIDTCHTWLLLPPLRDKKPSKCALFEPHSSYKSQKSAIPSFQAVLAVLGGLEY
jgi:hypothetical protein